MEAEEKNRCPTPRAAGSLGEQTQEGENTDAGEKRCPPVVNQRRQEKQGPGRVATTSSFPEDTNTEERRSSPQLGGEGWRGRGET